MDERRIDVAPAAIAKVIAAIALVWLWLHLWQLVMTRRQSGRGVYRRVMRTDASQPQSAAAREVTKKALDAA